MEISGMYLQMTEAGLHSSGIIIVADDPVWYACEQSGQEREKHHQEQVRFRKETS